MSSISVDHIKISLTANEAIDVGMAIRDRLVATAQGGYDVEKNHPDMLKLCKQLLNTAYGHDYGKQVDSDIAKVSSKDDTLDD